MPRQKTSKVVDAIGNAWAIAIVLFGAGLVLYNLRVGEYLHWKLVGKLFGFK